MSNLPSPRRVFFGREKRRGGYLLAAVTKRYKSGVVCVVDGSDLQPPFVPPFLRGTVVGIFLCEKKNVLFCNSQAPVMSPLLRGEEKRGVSAIRCY
jgi:hypothetical protein